MDWRDLFRKLWAPVAFVGALLLKVGLPALKFGSIFISVGGYALIWGWQFALGFVLLIFVHELGHYVEARDRASTVTLRSSSHSSAPTSSRTRRSAPGAAR